MSDVQQRIDQLVKGHRVVLFMKGTAQFPMCGFSGRAIQILKACGVDRPDDGQRARGRGNPPGHQGIRQLADDSAAVRQRRVRRRLGHHDGDVPVGRAAASARLADRARVVAASAEHRLAPRLVVGITGATGALYARAAAGAAARAPAHETHLVATPAGVLNVHHELGLDRQRARGAGHDRLPPGRRRRLHRQRLLRGRGDGRRALLDEVAGRDRPRPIATTCSPAPPT